MSVAVESANTYQSINVKERYIDFDLILLASGIGKSDFLTHSQRARCNPATK